MKVKDLKKLIEKLPDDMVVVTTAFDHSYRIVNARPEDAELSKSREYFEYHGSKHMFPGSKKEKVLVIT